MEDVENWLSENCGHKVRFTVPQRGDKSRFLKMVNKNAEESYKVYKFKRDKEQSDGNKILASLRDVLTLENVPYRIESDDISNISGKESVGAEIVYENAKPMRKHYRKFNIKSVDGANDYASMQEVILRRFKEAYKEDELLATGEMEKGKEKFLPLPDLILLDGGKGHVSAIKEVLSVLEEDVPVFGLVKDDKHRTRALTDENTEYEVEKDSELFKFLFGMQEEVHRYAITAFRNKHQKSATASELEKIKGVGNEKRKRLLKYFGSVKNISKTSLDELEAVLDKKTAKSVYEYYHK
jgi:excinuclease ABC subunit C